MKRVSRAAVVALLATAAIALAGCADLGYYWQSASGHARLIGSARPVEAWLADERTPPALKEKLALARRIRAFASAELALPDNASYRRYADLHRRAVVWNVVAAPPDSLALHTWCFPVVGCVGYRGYFDEADAKAQERRLAATGLETAVYPVPAYSTLGWSNWVGGDPLLSTFIDYPEADLARLVFHELAHQVAYAAGDTPFNESFATAVERIGGERWLAAHAKDGAQAAASSERQRALQARRDVERGEFRALTRTTRDRLKTIYERKAETAQELRASDAPKTIAMESFRDDWSTLRARWIAAVVAAGISTPEAAAERYRWYDRWVAEANNASFGAQAAYDDWVPAFTTLYEREGRDLPRFYAAVRELAKLPKDERHRRLGVSAEGAQASRAPKSAAPAAPAAPAASGQ